MRCLTLSFSRLPEKEANYGVAVGGVFLRSAKASIIRTESKMADLVLTTYDWVAEMPRGFVRDLRVRWALEEAGLPYRVERMRTPFRERGA